MKPEHTTGGRPTDAFVKKAKESLSDWLRRCQKHLVKLDRLSVTAEERRKFLEIAGKTAERFGKYTGYEKVVVTDSQPLRPIIDLGNMTADERRELLDMLN